MRNFLLSAIFTVSMFPSLGFCSLVKVHKELTLQLKENVANLNSVFEYDEDFYIAIGRNEGIFTAIQMIELEICK